MDDAAQRRLTEATGGLEGGENADQQQLWSRQVGVEEFHFLIR